MLNNKKVILKRHYRTIHINFVIDFPPKTKVHKKQFEKFKQINNS